MNNLKKKIDKNVILIKNKVRRLEKKFLRMAHDTGDNTEYYCYVDCAKMVEELLNEI